MKKQGISLVALVITIIVLIILTGAVIVTFMEGGIIDRAKEATFKSDIRTYQEQLSLIRVEDQIAISTNQKNYEAKVMDKTLTGEVIKEILPEFKIEEYGDLIQVVDGEIVAKEELDEEVLEEKWLIDLGIGLGEDEVADVVYTTGEEVTIGTEKFRVLKDNGSTLILLTEKCITTDTYVQSASVQTLAFSSTNYWSSETEYPYNLNENYVSSRQEGDALKIAEAYASKISEDTGVEVTGRLLTIEEVVELGGGDGSTAGCPIWINKDDDSDPLNYWLGSADLPAFMWLIEGLYGNLASYDYDDDFRCGVRPVITIAETAVTKI